ncbi:Type I HSP40 co-chaperone, partial [Spiromyces aspiralis]
MVQMPLGLDDTNVWYIDFHQWLGVPHNASIDDIQRAYVPWVFLADKEDPKLRALIRKKMHAYQILSDTKRRNIYMKLRRTRARIVGIHLRKNYYKELAVKLQDYRPEDTDGLFPYWSNYIGNGRQSGPENEHYKRFHEEFLFYRHHIDGKLCQEFYEFCVVFDQRSRGDETEEDKELSRLAKSRRAYDAEIVAQLKVTLDEFYTGMVVTAPVPRYRVCTECKGRSPLTYYKPCGSCFGTDSHDSGIEMDGSDAEGTESDGSSESFKPCYRCQGLGDELVRPRHCDTCSGKGEVLETIQHVVNVTGMGHGDRCFLRDGGHEMLSLPQDQPIHDAKIRRVTGPLILALEEQPHRKYKRVGDDLFCEVTIDQGVAINGGVFYINYLADEVLTVHMPPNALANGSFLAFLESQNSGKRPAARPPSALLWGRIRGYGMPKFSSNSECGDLFIRFQLVDDDEHGFDELPVARRSKSIEWLHAPLLKRSSSSLK